MSNPRNDFSYSRGSMRNDPDAAYDELRDRRDEEARTPEPVLTAEEQKRLDEFDLSEVELANQLFDQRWGK